ncbi:MAG: ExbD/TolR family protein [Planctomycetota bacterium]|jgi:biopolymer transport protein ExbD
MSAAAKMMNEFSSEMDMTPMIDIVFNLLIFFMVVTDLSQKDLANLTLPLAHMADQDKDNDPDDRIILNVDQDGFVMWKSKRINLDELGAILGQLKDRYELRMRRKGQTGLEDLPGGGKASKLYVLLRADKETPWQHVQWLMTVMAEQKLYKMQFATKKYADAAFRQTLPGNDKEEWEILDGRWQKDTEKKGG